MRISIIIVNYRSANLVGDLLASISRQGRGWVDRVMVVDNASGDGSVEALRAMITTLGISNWVEVLDAGRNAGFGAGNNVGAATSLRAEFKPDLLWFLNPDTLVDDVELMQMLNWFRSNEQVGIVGTGLDDGRGGKDLGGHRDASPVSEFVRTAGAFGMLRRYAVSDESLDRPGPVDWVSGASLIMRSSTFEDIGGFDEGFFLYFEEVDLCRRARKAGWDVVYEPRVRVMHLEGQTTGVRKNKPRPRYWYESRRRYFVKHFGRLGLLRADALWAFGRVIGAMRLRSGDNCRWRDMWNCDRPVIFGGAKKTIEAES
jgi:N-acetylglucosaminyl-diphospho-decaprenol L-rhamnosyltransferase